MSLRSRWIGVEGAAFERVGLVFDALGFVKPMPDAGSDGAYAVNIARQYQSDMSESQALDIIAYALRSARDSLRYNPPESLRDIPERPAQFR